MKIAITSPNGKTISGHAGKCPGYLIFEIEGIQIKEKYRVKLVKEQTFRNFSGLLSASPEHPLNGINAFISQGMGQGLQQRLFAEGILPVVTEESNPEQAIFDLLERMQ